MAATSEKVSIILTSTNPSGTVKQKSFTDISPDASNAELLAFSRAVNQLTDSVYGRTDKVTKIHVDSDPSGGKQTATITLNSSSVSLAALKTALKSSNRLQSVGFAYDGDAQPYAVSYHDFLGCGLCKGSAGNFSFNLFSGSDGFVDQIAAGTVTIRADETDNFKAAEAVFTVTA